MKNNFPLLFLGHGSPMNAIEENEFVNGFREIARTIPKPKAILSISAHWVTIGTRITSTEHPKTIHDFYGFPKRLYEIEYPALGNPELAKEIQTHLGANAIELDTSWGLDHGTWSVLKHLYPNADIPVVELSLDSQKTISEHYQLARQLSFLRKQEVLVIGSGNIVHNLNLLDWNHIAKIGYLYDWAEEASKQIKEWILQRKHFELSNIYNYGKIFQLAIPTLEHYLPLIYILALQEEKESIFFFNDQGVGGSLTMTSLKIFS